MSTYKGRKILGAKLHSLAFIGGSQFTDISTTGTKACDIEIQDAFLLVTFKAKNACALVPMVNVVQVILSNEVEKEAVKK